MSTTAALLLAAASAPASAAAAASVQASASVAATGVIEATSAIASVVASMLPSGLTTTAPVTAQHLIIPMGVELVAVFTGALFAGIRGAERKFDIMGVLTLAMTGLVGGIVRDLIIGTMGVAAFASNYYLVTALAAGLIAFFFTSAAGRLRPVFFIIDTISLGLFAVVGADKALYAGFTLVPAILLGIMTAIGGGLARDFLCGDPPALLRPGLLYGAAAAMGATVFVLLTAELGIAKLWAGAVTVIAVIAVRVLATRLGWQTPLPNDLTPRITQAAKLMARIGGSATGTGAGRSPEDDD